MSRTLIKGFFWSILLLTVAAIATNAQSGDDKEKLLRRNWSLFLEYYKMADYSAALRSGWEVLNLDPKRFNTAHDKMIEIYDSLATRAARKGDSTYALALADTAMMILEDNIENFPDERNKLLLRKGYLYEHLYADRSDDAIIAYETGIAGDYLNTHEYYLDRLARLYASKPEHKMKAVQVLQKMLERDPNNATAQAMMKSLITDPEEYVGVLRDAYYADSENVAKLYELANAFYDNLQMYDSAIVYFNRLVKADPSVKNYWERLGLSYQKLGQYKSAAKAYEQVVKLDPENKESWLNLAASTLQEGDLSKARSHAEKAASLDKNWGRPYLVIAETYDAALRRCVESKRGSWEKMKIIDKAVAILIQDTYARAAQDPDVADQARARAKGYDTLTPSSEDLFVNKIKKGSSYTINGDCYGWINRTVTMR